MSTPGWLVQDVADRSRALARLMRAIGRNSKLLDDALADSLVRSADKLASRAAFLAEHGREPR